MKHTKEYEQFLEKFGENANLILLHTLKIQKGKLDETKRAKILGTLRTGKNDSGSLGIGGKTSKTVSSDKPSTR